MSHTFFMFTQDIHFSQIFGDNIIINPAKIGSSNNDYRFCIQRKSQWKSIGAPYTSFSSTYESKNLLNRLNVGIQFLSDKSGDGQLQQHIVNLGLSKNYKFHDKDDFSLGLLFGLGQLSIDYSNLIFETPENFMNSNFLYPDLSAGFHYSILLSNSIKSGFGCAVYHITKPKYSLYNDKNVFLNRKNNFYFDLSQDYNDDLKIIYKALYSKQGNTQELLLGIHPNIDLEEIIINPMLFYRLKDAYVFGIGFKTNHINFNISYDINISDLNIASTSRGGFEFSIVYLWNKKYNHKKYNIDPKCPNFI